MHEILLFGAQKNTGTDINRCNLIPALIFSMACICFSDVDHSEAELLTFTPRSVSFNFRTLSVRRVCGP